MSARGIAALAVATALLAVSASVALGFPAGSTVLVSRPDGLGPVPAAFDNDSREPVAASDDGRYVLFKSLADGFASGIDPFHENLLVRDTVTGTTTLASRSDGMDGAGANLDTDEGDIAVATIGGQPHVLVAFSTFATNIVDHATGTVVNDTPGHSQVYLRDVTIGETTLISRADTATGAPASFRAQDPAIAIAGSGPIVAFTAFATNFGANGTGDAVYIRRVGTNDTELVSCKNMSCGGTPDIAFAGQPDVRVVPAAPGSAVCATPAHAECILVAFTTSDTTITNDGDGTPTTQAVLAIAESGQSTGFLVLSLPDQALAPVANQQVSQPAISGDGQAFAFVTDANNLTLDATAADQPDQAFLRIPGAGASHTNRTFLLSKSVPGGEVANSRVFGVDLGGTAAVPRAVFGTDATNLGGTSRQDYLRDHAAGTTTLLNRAPGPSGAAGNRTTTGSPRISPDGTVGLFASRSTNLGDGDPGVFDRVRLRRLTTPGQEVELVSRPAGFEPFKALMHRVFGTATSADGRYVAFASNSAALSDEDADGATNVYVRDLALGRTELVSRATGPSGAPAQSATLGDISADGRKVAFTASDLTPDSPAGATQAYVRDLDAATTTLVSRANGPDGAATPSFASAPSLSDDGRLAVFSSDSPLDPSGGDGKFHLYLRDLIANTTALVDRGPAGEVAPFNAFEFQVSGDGSRVVWTSEAAYADAPADGLLHVFVRNLEVATTELVSRADGAGGVSANGDSRSPAIDGDGDVVTFVSSAQNLGETFVNSQVFVRDLATDDTELISRATGNGTIAASVDGASVDASGRRISFSAAGALDDTFVPPLPFVGRVYLRDRDTSVTSLVGRADGLAGTAGNGSGFFPDISANGDCVAFTDMSTNFDDGFGSADFGAIHLRVLRNECAVLPPAAAPPQGPALVPPTAGPVTASPAVLSNLRVRPRRFRTRGRRRGTRISFRLDKAARVTLTFHRLLPGRRRGRRCVPRRRTGRRCVAARRVGRLRMDARAGANRRRFRGSLRGRRLRPGRYRLRARPEGGVARAVRFRVLRPRR